MDDIANLKNSTYCIALCEMKKRIELNYSFQASLTYYRDRSSYPSLHQLSN